MIRTAVRRMPVGLAALVAVVLAGLTAAPASANSMYFSRSSGTTASASWLEVGTLPGGVAGNIHFGSLWIEDFGSGRVGVFGEVFDLTCEPGVIPDGPGGGGHGEEEPSAPEGCVHEGVRFIKGGDVAFTMDRRFTTARLTGTLQVFGHDGPAGSPPVDMTLTGVGSTYKSVESGTFSDGFETYSYRYSFSGRDATVSGRIGAMVFDPAPEWAYGQMGTYRSMDRSRS